MLLLALTPSLVIEVYLDSRSPFCVCVRCLCFFKIFLSVFQVLQDEAIKQKEIFANELQCLREELKQIRDDRDRQLGQVHVLTEEVARHKESTGKTCTQLDKLMIKTNALEVCCFVLFTFIYFFFFYFINSALLCPVDLCYGGVSLQETCSSQKEQIHVLQQQLFAEKEKLKVI